MLFRAVSALASSLGGGLLPSNLGGGGLLFALFGPSSLGGLLLLAFFGASNAPFGVA